MPLTISHQLNTGQRGIAGNDVNAERAWLQGITGCGSVVAIVDTGMCALIDLYVLLLLQANKNLKTEVDVGMKSTETRDGSGYRGLGVFYSFLYHTSKYMYMYMYVAQSSQLLIQVCVRMCPFLHSTCASYMWNVGMDRKLQISLHPEPSLVFVCFFTPTSTSILKFLFTCFCWFFLEVAMSSYAYKPGVRVQVAGRALKCGLACCP